MLRPAPRPRHFRFQLVVGTLVARGLAATLCAQTTVGPATPGSATPLEAPVPSAVAHASDGRSVTVQTAAATPAPPLSRWLDFQMLSAQIRYRHIETSAGVTATSQVQTNLFVHARVKLDREARVSIGVAAGSGNGFTSAWNNTGIGTGDARWAMYLK